MIAAIIPSRFYPPELSGLLAVLGTDHVEPFVIDSRLFDHRIYAMWNAGVTYARAEGASFIAVLNDDVGLLPGSLPMMAQALANDPALGVVYPDCRFSLSAGMPDEVRITSTTGTWGTGGMTGFCFMFRADLPIRFDESFNWWYGDDRFEADVRRAGLLVGRIERLPVEHHPDGSAHKVWDELAPLIAKDRARWDGVA